MRLRLIGELFNSRNRPGLLFRAAPAYSFSAAARPSESVKRCPAP
jgi:hypothetical protein